jgi:hypothetical protein
VSNVRPFAAAGLIGLAAAVLAPDTVMAARTAQTVYIVTQLTGDRPTVTTGKRLRGLIMAALAKRGHIVRDGEPAASKESATILRVTANHRILRGAYTTRATVGLRAMLLEADTKKFIAHYDFEPERPWRLAASCALACIDHELQRRVRQLAARLALDVDRGLVRFARTRRVAAEKANLNSIGVAFRRIDRTLLPQIEQYLRNFPGVTGIRRDYAAATGVLYRLDHDGAAAGADLSIRKMLHHLQIKARISRTGNTYVIDSDSAAKPAAGSQDW